MILRTPRLTLRPLKLSDAEALFQAFGDAETMRYWAYGPVASVDALRQRMTQYLTSDGEPENNFAVCDRDNGPALGRVSLYGFRDANAEVGYIFARAAQGKGYASEAVTALLDYAFETRGLHRIALDIDPENSASIRLAQRLGFRWEGHFRESFLREGQYLDSIYYAMLAQEWRSRGA